MVGYMKHLYLHDLAAPRQMDRVVPAI